MSKVRLPIFLLIGAVIAWLVWRWQRTLAKGASLALPAAPSSAPTLTAPNATSQSKSEPVPMRQQQPAAPTVSMPQVAPKVPVIPMPEVSPAPQTTTPAPEDTAPDNSAPNVPAENSQPITDESVTPVAVQSEQAALDSETPDMSAAGGTLDLNDATLDELIALPGIGPALAQRIVDYRQEHGPFQSVEALVDIQGIGNNSIQEFEHLLTVRTTDSPDSDNSG